MINQIHALLHRPENGWDPVRPEYAASYAETFSGRFQAVSLVESWVGGLAGKRVLDVGGGPGQCSIAFAERGAEVTWHDVSASYLAIARQRALQRGLGVSFSLGYFEDARKFGPASFDIVFNQVCWYYCMADRPFADLIYELVRPGGTIYVETPIEGFSPNSGRRDASARAKIFAKIYRTLGYKVGHPMPPRGLLARLFQRHPIARMDVDYSDPQHDRLLIRKP